jgi:hypothetical protein
MSGQALIGVVPAGILHYTRMVPRITHHRGTEGEERTSKASSFATIMIGLNLTSRELRLLCLSPYSLWLCGGSSAFVPFPG